MWGLKKSLGMVTHFADPDTWPVYVYSNENLGKLWLIKKEKLCQNEQRAKEFPCPLETSSSLWRTVYKLLASCFPDLHRPSSKIFKQHLHSSLYLGLIPLNTWTSVFMKLYLWLEGHSLLTCVLGDSFHPWDYAFSINNTVSSSDACESFGFVYTCSSSFTVHFFLPTHSHEISRGSSITALS